MRYSSSKPHTGPRSPIRPAISTYDTQARERHPDPRIRWREDSLPSLTQTHRLGLEFDFILTNAVWMHVRREDRKRAFRKLVTLPAPGGRIAISLRLRMHDPDRIMYTVSRAAVERLARDFGLRVMRAASGADGLSRAHAHWETLVVEYPLSHVLPAHVLTLARRNRSPQNCGQVQRPPRTLSF